MRLIPLSFHMRQLILQTGFLLFTLCISAQQTITDSIVHNELTRTFILYVPDSYDPEKTSPLVLNFHGYTSGALEQLFYGDFRAIADTAGFIVVHPQGTDDALGNPHWNVGWGTSTVDDVSFVVALIDALSTQYSINPERVYSTGMSNGGYFSYRLACELSDRIAAIASVTGSMNTTLVNSCMPERPVPVMEIHGTADAVVPYTGNFFTAAIPDVLAFWVDFNDCNPEAEVTQVEDNDPNDGSTAEHQVYAEGNAGASVEHYRIINGAHTWPGTAFGGTGTNQDVNASAEIWRFFSKYDINGLIQTSSHHTPSIASNIKLYPNPGFDELFITSSFDQPQDYVVYDLLGQVKGYGTIDAGDDFIPTHSLTSGAYYVRIGDVVLKWIKINR